MLLPCIPILIPLTRALKSVIIKETKYNPINGKEDVSVNEKLSGISDEIEIGNLHLFCDTNDGTWSVGGKSFNITGACAKIKTERDTVSVTDFVIHETERTDDFVIFMHRGHPELDISLIQTFKQNGAFLSCTAQLVGELPDVREIIPIFAELDLPNNEHDTIFLSIPHDGTELSEFVTLDKTAVGHGVAAFVNKKTDAGIVIGFDKNDCFDGVIRLSAGEGISHGFSAECIPQQTRECNSRICIGEFSDWRDGMNAYAANFMRDFLTECTPKVEITDRSENGDTPENIIRFAEKVREVWTEVSIRKNTKTERELTANDILCRQTAYFWKKHSPTPMVLSDNVTERGARYRMTAAVVGENGIVIGDELSDIDDNEEKTKRLTELLCNTDVAYAAHIGGRFVPHGRFFERRFAETYRLSEDGALYLAVFNSEDTDRTMRHELAGYLPDGLLYLAVELWSGDTRQLEGSVLTHELSAGDAAIFRITPMAGNEQTLAEEPASPNGKNDLLSLLVCGAASLGILAAAAVLYGKRKNDPEKKN